MVEIHGNNKDDRKQRQNETEAADNQRLLFISITCDTCEERNNNSNDS